MFLNLGICCHIKICPGFLYFFGIIIEIDFKLKNVSIDFKIY